MRKDKDITGQIIFREIGSADRMLPGANKKLMIIFGIVAIPNESDFKGEHQYEINGDADENFTQLFVPMKNCIDRSDETIGDSPTVILKSPIWRV